jgi:hypothetical protein
MNSNNVVFKKREVVFGTKEPVRKQDLGITEVKEASKKMFFGTAGMACRVVVFNPA